MDEASVLATKLRLDGEKFTTFLQTLGEDERHAAVYTEGALWTVRSVLAHVMSAEKVFFHLFRNIRQSDVGVDAEFDIDRFNASEQTRLEQLSWDELLGMFQDGRARMIDFVNSLAVEDLEKVGRHPFLGVASLRDMVKMIYIHDKTHLRDMRRALGVG